MIKYTVKRLLFFIPSVFFISVMCFLLIRSMPGDVVDHLIRDQTDERANDAKEVFTQKYRQKASELGTDLPSFYVELSSLSAPRHLSYEWNPVRKNVISAFIDETGNVKTSEAWYNSVENINAHLYKYGGLSLDKQLVIDAKKTADKLLYESDAEEISILLIELKAILEMDTVYHRYSSTWITEAETNWKNLQEQKSTWKNYIPVLRFHSPCAYDIWLFGDGKNNRGVIRGDFGTSLIDRKPVNDSLLERIGLTVILSLISVFLAFLVSVPLGVVSALYNNSIFEKTISTIIFVFYALPTFWVASLSIMWLAGGDGLDWFSPYGTGKITPDMNVWDIIVLKWKHFALPIFAWTYSGIAFITKQTKTAVLDNTERLYIKSAIARGLPFKQVLWKHVMPNSLRPLITMVANILPGLIGGSVVLETIFSLPGLGEWAYRAFLYKDFPVIMAVLFWGSLLTLTGYLVSDILLAVTDPKIRFTSNKK